MKSSQPTKSTNEQGQEEIIDYPADAMKQEFLLSLFAQASLPLEAVESKNEFLHLFNTASEGPVLFSFKKKGRGMCFERKDEYPQPKKRTPKPNRTALPAKQQWRVVDATDPFFDTFKGKADKKAVENFKAAQKIQSVNEINHEFTGEAVRFLELPPDCGVFKVSEEGEERLRERVRAYDGDYFVDFRAVYQVNIALGFEKDYPLWYILHPDLGNSFGPISTWQLEKLHKSCIVKSFYLIRLIDIFTIRPTEAIFFFKLSDLENEELLMNLTVSPMLPLPKQSYDMFREEPRKQEYLSQPKKNNYNGPSLYAQTKPKTKKKTKAKEMDFDIRYEEKANPYDY